MDELSLILPKHSIYLYLEQDRRFNYTRSCVRADTERENLMRTSMHTKNILVPYSLHSTFALFIDVSALSSTILLASRVVPACFVSISIATLQFNCTFRSVPAGCPTLSSVQLTHSLQTIAAGPRSGSRWQQISTVAGRIGVLAAGQT